MNTNNSPAASSKSLNAYLLGAGALTTMAATSSAVIVPIAIGNGPGEFDIGGINGGVSSGNSAEIEDFPFAGGGLLGLQNAAQYGYTGLGHINPPGGIEVSFAYNGNYLDPVIFSLGDPINAGLGFGFSNTANFTAFASDYNATFPDLGPGSYMGFYTLTGNLGWLEVTWDGTAKEFQILSGAYESEAGVAIPAGAVPEPSAIALLVGGAAGLMTLRRRQQKDS